LWRTFPEGIVTLSEGGALATQKKTMLSSVSLTTTGTEITEGKHYWEVVCSRPDLSRWASVDDAVMIGISRPNLDL
jgi:hypothetical protein